MPGVVVAVKMPNLAGHITAKRGLLYSGLQPQHWPRTKRRYGQSGSNFLLIFVYIILAAMAPLANGTATLVAPNPHGDPQIIPKTFNIRIEVGASALDALQLALEPASLPLTHYRTHGLNSTTTYNANTIPANTVFDFNVTSLTTLANDIDVVNAVEFYEKVSIDYVFTNPGTFVKTGTGPNYNPQDYPTGTVVIFRIHYKVNGGANTATVLTVKTFDSETSAPTLTVSDGE